MEKHYRIEKDSMGEVQVENSRHWGAQTERSLRYFAIGNEKMPFRLIKAIILIKKAAAKANASLGAMTKEKAGLILTVCDEILQGGLTDEFPLSVWQTGSGTQTNMNVNEVIAHRGNELAGKKLLHPNDDVNRSQSTNDVFPSAMHMASVEALFHTLFPALAGMIYTLQGLEAQNNDVIKLGRTHLQDATPMRFSDEIRGWRGMLESAKKMLADASLHLYPLPLGGTAIGTGLNAPAQFDRTSVAMIREMTSFPFQVSDNKFHALSSKDALVFLHGALSVLATNLLKLANDVRWLASGPRAGIGEIKIPENEPGSSIMPGKVNPTQSEAMAMVCCQVMGNDVTVGVAASQGNFQLNAFMPVIIYNVLQSIELLADAIHSFDRHCLMGLSANRESMQKNVNNSLMLVTALTPVIGYEKAAEAARFAHENNLSLEESVQKLGLLDQERFRAAVRPEKML